MNKEWFLLLGMCNKSFLNETYVTHVTTKHPEIHTGRIKAFYERWSMFITSIFVNALRSLKNNNLIECSTEYTLNVNGNYHTATEEETNAIQEIEDDVIHNIMHYNTLQDIFKANKQREYFKHVNKQIQSKLNYDSYYKQTRITYIQDTAPPSQEESYITAQKLELNQKILDYAYRKEQDIANIQKEKLGEQFDPDYYSKSLTLAEEFIRIIKDN